LPRVWVKEPRAVFRDVVVFVVGVVLFSQLIVFPVTLRVSVGGVRGSLVMVSSGIGLVGSWVFGHWLVSRLFANVGVLGFVRRLRVGLAVVVGGVLLIGFGALVGVDFVYVGSIAVLVGLVLLYVGIFRIVGGFRRFVVFLVLVLAAEVVGDVVCSFSAYHGVPLYLSVWELMEWKVLVSQGDPVLGPCVGTVLAYLSVYVVGLRLWGRHSG